MAHQTEGRVAGIVTRVVVLLAAAVFVAAVVSTAVDLGAPLTWPGVEPGNHLTTPAP